MSQPCSKTFFDNNNGSIFTCPLTPEQIGIIFKGVSGVAKNLLSNQFKQMTVENHLKSMRTNLIITGVVALCIIIWVGFSFVMIDHITYGTFMGIVLFGIFLILGLSFGANYFLAKNIEKTFDSDMTTLVKTFQTQFGSIEDLGDTSKPIGQIFDEYKKSSSPACPCNYDS